MTSVKLESHYLCDCAFWHIGTHKNVCPTGELVFDDHTMWSKNVAKMCQNVQNVIQA